jgi:hypothetical protein
MSIRSVRLPIAFVLTAALLTGGQAAARAAGQSASPLEDRVIGTWTLDVDKSTYNPGPPPRSQRRTYEAHPEGIKATIVTVDAEGHVATTEYVAGYDSIEHPLSGSAEFNAIALKRVNPETAEATLRHGRKLIGMARRVISKDGKTMTITFEGTDSRGRNVRNVAVYAKQSG